jgi:flagellar biosynthesis/type III secretory pathway protein FliH
MEQRLLEYTVKAFRRYQCFVDSYVIFLRGGGGNLKPPLVRTRSDGRIGLMFFYEVILMREIPHEELLAQVPRGVWPFIPFSKGGAQRAVIDEIITRLTPARDEDTKELLPLVFFFAELALPDQQEVAWLKRRKAMLDDFLRESSIYQDILAEGKQEGEKEGEAKAKKERVLSLRGKILILVQNRFPQLKPLADQQIVRIEVPDPLEDLLLEIGMAQSVEEALQYLQKAA